MGTLPRRVMTAFARLNRDRRRRAPRGLLLAMAALVLCMPMSYRAGTAFSHPHAFFQVFIDAATGHGHHDAGEQPEQAGTFSPFVPPDVPLQQPKGDAGVRYRVIDGHIFSSSPAGDRASDTPALSALTAPLEQAAGIPALSLIVLLLFATDRRRAVWALTRTPRGLLPSPESPPPRLATT